MRGVRCTGTLLARTSMPKRQRRFMSLQGTRAVLDAKKEPSAKKDDADVYVSEGVATVLHDDTHKENNNDTDEQEAPRGFWRRMRPHLIAAAVAALGGTLYFQWAFIGHCEPYKRLLDFVSQCEEVTDSIGKVSEFKYYHPMSFVRSSGVWDAQELSWAGVEDVGMVDELRCYMKLNLQGKKGGHVSIDAEMRKFESGIYGWKPWSVHVTLYPEGEEEKEVTLIHHEYEMPPGMDQLITQHQ